MSDLEQCIINLVTEFSAQSVVCDAPYTKDFSSTLDKNKWKMFAMDAAKRLGINFEYGSDPHIRQNRIIVLEPSAPEELQRLLVEMQADIDRWVHDCAASAVEDHLEILKQERERARSHLQVVEPESKKPLDPERQALMDKYEKQILATYEDDIAMQEPVNGRENPNVIDLGTGL